MYSIYEMNKILFVVVLCRLFPYRHTVVSGFDVVVSSTTLKLNFLYDKLVIFSCSQIVLGWITHRSIGIPRCPRFHCHYDLLIPQSIFFTRQGRPTRIHPSLRLVWTNCRYGKQL